MTPTRFMWEEADLAPLRIETLAPGLLRTPLLTGAGCTRLLDELARRRGEAGPAEAPNSMHEFGLGIASLGLDGAVDTLIARSGLGAVIADAYSGALEGCDLDGHHSYVVEYGRDGDEDLGFHVDDSEVTLNLCLGETFSGAELVMLGRRCDRHRHTPVDPAEVLEIDHEPGTCVLHLGRHRHRVDPIRRGTRRNLIAWLRSSEFRRVHPQLGQGDGDPGCPCPPWCDV